MLVSRQKEKNREGCLFVSGKEFKDLKFASGCGWRFLGVVPEQNDPVFPNLSQTCTASNRRMQSQEFWRIFNRRSGLVFGRKVNATDIRKLIHTHMRHQPASVQRAVARAEGHGLDVADKHYNLQHPHELVETARKKMKLMAEQSKRNL